MNGAHIFRATLLEAGFIVTSVTEYEHGYAWDPPLPSTEEAGRAIWFAHEICGKPLAPCQECYARRRAEPGTWAGRNHEPCEHERLILPPSAAFRLPRQQ